MMNAPVVVEFKAVSAVLVGGVWHDVIMESFRITSIEAGAAGTLWEHAFSFKTTASSEHAYRSSTVTMSGPVTSIQAIRSAV